MSGAGAAEDAADRDGAARWGTVAFAASCLSALIYFATSLGIRNFVGFLVDGAVKFARLFGVSA